MKYLLVVAAVVVGLGYRFYRPAPEEFSDPTKSVLFMGIMHLIGDVATLGSYLGLGSHWNNTRSILSLSAKATNLVPIDDSVLIRDDYIGGVMVRMYIPENQFERNASAAVIFIHGGGWVIGDVETYDGFVRFLASKLDMPITSVDYRLAPEHPFPAPLDDCVHVTKYLTEHAEDYNVNPKKIIIMGDSAGGHLATAVSMRLRDEKFSPMPLSQVLIYPALQALDLQLPAYRANDKKTWLSTWHVAQFYLQHCGLDLKLTDEMMRNEHISPKTREKYAPIFDLSILPEKYRDDQKDKQNEKFEMDADWSDSVEKCVTNPYFSPLIADDLSNLPDAMILTLDFDVLRDDGLLYASRLRTFAVSVVHKSYGDTFHGAINAILPPFELKAGLRMVDDIAKYVAKKT